LVDNSDPSITKSGNLSELHGYITQWFEYSSTKKSLTISRDKELYYFTLCYWDNEHWDRQHTMLISFSESEKNGIYKLRKKIKAHNVGCKENFYQNTQSFTVLLPSKLSQIQRLSEEILRDIFMVPQDGVVNYTPDGFRLKMGQKEN